MEYPQIRKDFLALYSQEERTLINKLNELFEKWNTFYWEYRQGKEDLKDYKMIVPDGFYPNYLSQKIKILFLGRESYSIEGCNYIDLFTECYLTGIVGKGTSASSINTAKFHKMLIKVAWGILNNKSWNDIPQANRLCDEKIFDKLSFAFMNLSKLSNNLFTQETTQTNWQLVDHSIRMSINSKMNLIAEEIDLLKPDLIIAMNIPPAMLEKVFGTNLEGDRKNDFVYKLKSKEDDIKKDILLLNPYHFSSTKCEKTCIYNPIHKKIADIYSSHPFLPK